MGWISDRHMREGGSIGGNAKKCRETCRHPLRKIVAVVRHQSTIFEPNAVTFECGHDGYSYGTHRVTVWLNDEDLAALDHGRREGETISQLLRDGGLRLVRARKG